MNPSNWHFWVALVLVYIFTGSMAVILSAYLVPRITGRHWFSRGWCDDWSYTYPPPVLVLLFWPLVTVGCLIYFPINGIINAISGASHYMEDVGNEHRKSVGDFRKNPT